VARARQMGGGNLPQGGDDVRVALGRASDALLNGSCCASFQSCDVEWERGLQWAVPRGCGEDK